jgi:hypothetical protein
MFGSNLRAEIGKSEFRVLFFIKPPGKLRASALKHITIASFAITHAIEKAQSPS